MILGKLGIVLGLELFLVVLGNSLPGGLSNICGPDWKNQTKPYSVLISPCKWRYFTTNTYNLFRATATLLTFPVVGNTILGIVREDKREFYTVGLRLAKGDQSSLEISQ